MIDLLILLLVPALKFLDNPRKHWYFFWAPIPGWAVDLVVARTTFALVAGRGPRDGERTVSDMLEHLAMDYNHPDRALFYSIGRTINRRSGLPHIKVCAA